MRNGTWQRRRAATAATAVLFWGGAAAAQTQERDLARALANPLAAMISVPLQYNADQGFGPGDGERSLLNVQPVVPIRLNEDWNVISRTIVPVVELRGVAPGGGVSGIGDVVQSFFFSPQRPTAGGWIVGAGPVLLLPTGSESLLTADRWGAGPTAVALKQSGPWTVGGLANHVWSVGGGGGAPGVSTTLLQPFVSYITATKTTFSLNTEATHDWEREAWSVPIHATVSQLLEVGRQPLSVSLGARYWAESPAGGAEGWGLRAGVTFLFRR